MDCHGRMLAHVLLHESDGILSMSWNYPIFLVEDSSESDTDSDDYSPPQDGPAAYPIPVQNTKPLLTVSFTSGDISLMNNYDDLSPTVIRSGLKGTKYAIPEPHRWQLCTPALQAGAFPCSCRVLLCDGLLGLSGVCDREHSAQLKSMAALMERRDS